MSGLSTQIRAAVHREDGMFHADSPQTPGVWGRGSTPMVALDDYCSALAGWLALKSSDGDDDLPTPDWTFSS